MKIRTASSVVAALALAAPPAIAQHVEEVDLMAAGLASVLAICVPAIHGNFDLNDAAALGQYGLRPGTPEREASLRSDLPGLELATAKVSDGSVTVAANAGKCNVIVRGAAAIEMRDELIRQLAATPARQQRDDSGGSSTQAFYFTHEAIFVDTKPTGTVTVSVRLQR